MGSNSPGSALRGLIVLIGAALAAHAADPRAVLAKAFEVTGFSNEGEKVLHWHDIQGVEQNYQSAPPFITVSYSRECWVDPKSGAERVESQQVFPGGGRRSAVTTLFSRTGIFSMRDGKAAPAAGSPGQRNLDVWAVLADWRDAPDVRAARDEVFQGFPRTVLARRGEFGEERLFLDPKSGFPLKLDREETHYLWGQVRVEFTWAIWQRIGSAMAPAAAARVVDGFKEITRTIDEFEFVERTKAPDLSTPAGAGRPDPLPAYLQPRAPQRVDVSPNVFLSVNPGYTEAFALIGGTIYVFDATQGEERARQDLELVRAAFPGVHPIVLVVSDTAWPHIGGLRYWVAQDATVISQATSRDILARVVERRWTRAPDLLEQRRKAARFKFVSVNRELVTAGGKLRIFAVDGTENEGSVMAFVPGERLLWACDCIQDVSRANTNTIEVWQAVQRAGIAPDQVAAMHIPLTAWSRIEELIRSLH